MQAFLKEIDVYLSNEDFTLYNIDKPKKIGFYSEGKVVTLEGIFSFSDISYKEYCLINKPVKDHRPLVIAAVFLAKMVYDNFYEKNDPRLPNDLYAIDYPNNYLNFDYMRYERELLLKSSKQKNNYEKLSYLRMFLNVRDLRREMIEEGFSNQEYRLETITGLSYFAMYTFMNKYNKILTKKYVKDILSDFPNTTLNEFSFRRCNTYSGFLQLLVLNSLGYKIKDLYKENITIYNLAISKIKFIKEPISFKNDIPLIENLKNYEEEVQTIFSNFFIREPNKINGNFKLIGFNPQSIVKDKNNLFHPDFIVVEDLHKRTIVKYQGPLVTKIKEGSYNIVTCIYKY